MREQNFSQSKHDPFGWLKTLIVILVVFGLMIATGVMAARADACSDTCRAQHNECRLKTKGSPQCETQVNACVQQCLATLSKAKK